MEIKKNGVYRLQEDFGFGPGYVPAGTDVTIKGVFPPGTPGVGGANEDTVLASFTNAHGAVQSIAVGVSKFAQLFREVN